MEPGRRRVFRERHAERDLIEIVEHIARDNPQAAVNLIDAAEEQFDRLARTPELGSLCEFDDPDLADVRVWTIPGFRSYLIFYRFVNDEIHVLRVLHAARDVEKLFRKGDA